MECRRVRRGTHDVRRPDLEILGRRRTGVCQHAYFLWKSTVHMARSGAADGAAGGLGSCFAQPPRMAERSAQYVGLD